MHRKILSVMFCIFCAPSCKPSQPTASKEEAFALDQRLKQTHLSKIVEDKGRVEFCVDTKGTVPRDMPEKVSTETASALKEWLGALNGYADWPYDNVNIKAVNCSQARSNTIKIHLQENIEVPGLSLKLQNLFCVRFGVSAACNYHNRPYSLPATREIFLGVDGPSRFTILHELGHIFGLGDIYFEKGIRENIPQPFLSKLSVMECSAEHLQKDDINGLRWQWDFVKGRKSFKNADCGSGYQEWQPGTFKKTGALFCVANDTYIEGFRCDKPYLRICLENGGGKTCVNGTTSCGPLVTTITATPPSTHDWFAAEGEPCLNECIENHGGVACISTCQKRHPLRPRKN